MPSAGHTSQALTIQAKSWTACWPVAGTCRVGHGWTPQQTSDCLWSSQAPKCALAGADPTHTTHALILHTPLMRWSYTHHSCADTIHTPLMRCNDTWRDLMSISSCSYIHYDMTTRTEQLKGRGHPYSGTHTQYRYLGPGLRLLWTREAMALPGYVTKWAMVQSTCNLSRGWPLFIKFQNIILWPSHFVSIYIKKIQAKFEQDWTIFRGSSMPLKFCITSHMRYHKKLTWIRSLKVFF